MRTTSTNIAKFILSILFIIILFYNTDTRKLYSTVQNSNLSIYILAIFFAFLNFFITTYRWKILIRRFEKNTSFLDLFRYICLSFFYNFFIPGGFAGDLIRGYKCKGINLKSSQGIASVFIDRLMGLAAFTTFSLIGVFFTYNMLVDKKILVYLLMVLTIFILFAFFLFNRNFIKKFKSIASFHTKLFSKLKELYDFVYSYKDNKGILLYAFITSLGAGMCNIFVFYLIGVSIGGSVSFVYFVFFIPIIIIVSYLPISYSGLGVREASFVLLFTHVGLAANQALAISLMYFSLLMILGIFGGVIYLVTKT